MQLNLFEPTILRQVYLTAKSKRSAFYQLILTTYQGKFYVLKESGAGGKVLDRRFWPQPDEKTAIKFYERKVKEKLKSDRKRRYEKKWEYIDGFKV